jgi:hypothetical protein
MYRLFDEINHVIKMFMALSDFVTNNAIFF